MTRRRPPRGNGAFDTVGTPRGATPGPHRASTRRRPVWVLPASVAVALTALVAGAVLFLPDRSAAAEPVALEAVGELGEDPFAEVTGIAEVTDLPAEIRPPVARQAETDRAEVGVVDGTASGAHGGSPDQLLCDIEALDAALTAGDRSRVWASAFDVDAGDVTALLEGWTPVVLTADTWVTSHRFRDGAALAHQTVLERGTSVLIDERGTPRVKCTNGNPLLAPVLDGEVALHEPDGEPWTGFDAGDVVRVAPGDEEVDSFVVVDVEDGQHYDQPAGGTLEVPTLTLRPDGLGTARFGDDGSTVRDALEALLGPAERDRDRSYGGRCRTTTVWWGWQDIDGDTLIVEIDQQTGEFVAYSYTNSGPDPTPRFGVTTPEGFAVGAPVDTVAEHFDDVRRSTSAAGQTRLDANGYRLREAVSPGDDGPYVEVLEAGEVGCADGGG